MEINRYLFEKSTGKLTLLPLLSRKFDWNGRLIMNVERLFVKIVFLQL